MTKPCFVGDARTEAPSGMKALAVEQLEADTADQVPFFVISAEDPHAARNTLERIRRQSAPSIYLKPVVLLESNVPIAKTLSEAADGIYRASNAPQEEQRLLDLLHPFNQWISQLGEARKTSDVDPSFKVLRYLASRGRVIEPLMSIASPGGYLYPSLEPLLSQPGGNVNALQVLTFLESQNLVSGQYITKVHLCSHCACAFLNFKETCPDCQSDNIDGDELIHHFRCAYTGSKSDFEAIRGLQCPKCDRELRHLGVDYDKPSVVYHCNACSHRFQSPTVLCSCFQCGQTAEPEHQQIRRIQAYRITAIGNSAALYGMEHLFMRALDTELQLWAYDTTKQLVALEVARKERYQISSSSVAVLHFDNLSDLYVKFGQRAGEIFAEISQVLKSVLRRSDVIAAQSESTFVLLLTETPTQQADLAVERIRKGITDLLTGNLAYEARLLAQTHAVTASLDLDEAVETLVAQDA